MTPEQLAVMLERLERCEQLLTDYDVYIKALRQRIDELEYTRVPSFTPYIPPVGGGRRQ